MAGKLYTLEVTLLDGYMTDDFVRGNPVVSRTIEICDDQTLSQLYRAIFEAFHRWEQHMYEFQFGSGPHDRSGDRYVLPMEFEDPLDADSQATGNLMQTAIDSLGLAVGQAFGYWFDFGDDWYHQINVIAIGEAKPRTKYPRVTARVGDSPPQYVDWDAEGEDGE